MAEAVRDRVRDEALNNEPDDIAPRSDSNNSPTSSQDSNDSSEETRAPNPNVRMRVASDGTSIPERLQDRADWNGRTLNEQRVVEAGGTLLERQQARANDTGQTLEQVRAEAGTRTTPTQVIPDPRTRPQTPSANNKGQNNPFAAVLPTTNRRFVPFQPPEAT
jgi:hypothetical protein